MFKRPTIADSGYLEMLKWGSQTIKAADVVYKAYLDILFSAMYVFLDEEPYLKEGFCGLSVDSQKRIVNAPEVYNLLSTACRTDASMLHARMHDFIAVELWRTCSLADDRLRKWAADGSVFADFADSAITYDNGWLSSGLYFAPLIDDHIPIDYCSPFSRREMPVAEFRPIKFDNPAPLPPDSAHGAVLKILGAYDKITKGCPTAAEFLSKYVSAIVVRHNPGEHVFQSASRNSYIGEIVLLNPHHEFADEAYLAESLIHESIHSLMWRAEILSHFLKFPDDGEVVVVSPWSGQRINYYTLLQAVFVWYGVFNFWHMLRQCELFEKGRSEYLMRRAAQGFNSDNFQSSLRQHSHLLQSGIFETFVAMQDVVRDTIPP